MMLSDITCISNVKFNNEVTFVTTELRIAGLAEGTYRYREFSIQKLYQISNIFFNNKCLKFGLHPKYIHIRINRRFSTNGSSKEANKLRARNRGHIFHNSFKHFSQTFH